MKLIIPGELADLNTYINAERANRYAGAEIKKKMTKTALAYREMLKRLELSAIDNSMSPFVRYRCPICRNYKADGHAPDCELAALLKESEGEEE